MPLVPPGSKPTERRNKTRTFEQTLREHMSARGFVNLRQLAEVLEEVAKPKSAPVLGESELQAVARRAFAISPGIFGGWGQPWR